MNRQELHAELAKVLYIEDFNLVDTLLATVLANFKMIGDRWQDVAEIFKRGSAHNEPVAIFSETTDPMLEIADLEEQAWSQLLEIAK